MHYEVIVAGCGGVGSAALFHLARRGVRVLALDRFTPGHDRGSSHGATRIIRLAYFEHPNYVPLLRRAFDMWADLADESGERLYVETGLVQVGQSDGEVVRGVLRSAEQHGLEVEQFHADDAARAFPSLAFGPEDVAVYEQRAGYLRVEACVAAHVRLAAAHGAAIQTGVTIHGVERRNGHVAVSTDAGVFTADRCVLAPGAWAPALLGDLGLPFEVLAKHVYWFESGAGHSAPDGAPAFLFERPDGVYYGIPAIDERGVKVAEHTGGTPVADPLTVDRTDDPPQRQRVTDFVRARLPGLRGGITRHETCLYTMSPDGHFVVDRHPTVPGVVLAAGLSGHGFKFAAVLGEVLADLATDARPRPDVGFLRIAR